MRVAWRRGLLAMIVGGGLLVAVGSVRAAEQGPVMIPVSDALAQCSQGQPVVAWLGDPKLPVAWGQVATLEEGLALIDLAAPLMSETRDGVVIVTMPPVAAKATPLPLPGNLIRLRHVITSLTPPLKARLLAGERIPGKELPPAAARQLQAFVREQMGEEGIGNEAIVRLLAEGDIRLKFSPQVTAYSLTSDRLPGEWCQALPTEGTGASTTPDWSRAVGWAELAPATTPATPSLPSKSVKIDPGLYSLAECAKRLSEAGAPCVVEAGLSDRQVYLNVPAMPAGKLMKLVAEACALQLSATKDGVAFGSGGPQGDLFRLHRANLVWLLEAIKPATALPGNSLAAQLAKAALPSGEIAFASLPAPLKEYLEPKVPKPQGDAMLRLIPALGFELRGPEYVLYAGGR